VAAGTAAVFPQAASPSAASIRSPPNAHAVWRARANSNALPRVPESPAAPAKRRNSNVHRLVNASVRVDNGTLPGAVRSCELVVRVTVTATGLPLGVMELGVRTQLECSGAPVQVSAMAWLKPATGVTVSCSAAELPEMTVGDAVERLSEKSWPVPESEMD